jgi:hypothetical protein
VSLKILTTGRQIGSAVKNVPRVRQIVAVFSRYGFSDFIERTGFGRYLPGMLTRHTKALENLTTPERLRLAFEELGPTFIKLGQLLSTRADLLPESFIQEFTKLQDNVPSLPFEAISTVIREELKHDPNEIFASLNKTPLAAASIAQVHEATLKTGEKVVLKVQRPEIKKIIEQDIAILTGAARLLERYVPETRILSPHVPSNRNQILFSDRVVLELARKRLPKKSRLQGGIREVDPAKAFGSRGRGVRRAIEWEERRSLAFSTTFKAPNRSRKRGEGTT